MDWDIINFNQLPDDIQNFYSTRCNSDEKDKITNIKKTFPSGSEFSTYLVRFGDRGDHWKYVGGEWCWNVVYFRR